MKRLACIIVCQPLLLGDMVGEARLLKEGSRLCFFTVDITDELGTPVANTTATGARIQS